MGYFVCGTCGQSLKKNQVSTHWYKCRSGKHVSCMDCGKDFWGEEYAAHLKCITENEKYGGSNYVAKEMKGEKKQEQWVARIQEKVAATHNMDPQLRTALNKIIHLSNIPRKEAKFRNFLFNCVQVHPSLADRIWDIFKDANSSNINNNNNNNSNNKNTQPNPSSTSRTDNSATKTNGETVNGTQDGTQQEGKSEVTKLNKREKKELRREKQSKKSKKDKAHEEAGAGTKRKRGNEEEEEAVSKKKKKKKAKGGEEEEESGEIDKTKRKKKRKGDLALNDGTLETLQNGNAAEVNGEPAESNEPKKKKKKRTENGAPNDTLNDSFTNGNTRTVGQSDNRESTETDEPRKKKKKHRENGSLNDTLVADDEDPGRPKPPSNFKWTPAIKRVLREGPEEGLKVSKVQRKVLSLYCAAHGDAGKSKEELLVTLHKKLSKKGKFVLSKDKVKLPSDK